MLLKLMLFSRIIFVIAVAVVDWCRTWVGSAGNLIKLLSLTTHRCRICFTRRTPWVDWSRFTLIYILIQNAVSWLVTFYAHLHVDTEYRDLIGHIW